MLTPLSKQILWRSSYYLAPALLAIIALLQLGESSFGTLTRWKGGGFGMFSTYDSADARFLKAFILTDKGELPIPVPPEFTATDLLIQTWPRQAQLHELAKNLASKYWLSSPYYRQGLESEDDKARFPSLIKAENRPKIIVSTTQPGQFPQSFERLHVNGIRVEVWRVGLNAEQNALVSKQWMSAIAAVPENGGKS